ncbi:unnamed protein product, partial [Mesorhabditis belari]|uniref:Homeobox domain-containing protein n=1 Tax=Mesorhabditis belari TaxID=2138241 RepID=A0AAF3E8F8_9BILA
MMNPLGFDFAQAAAQASAASVASSEASAGSSVSTGSDHLQRLAAMTQGVGKEEGETSTPTAEALNYGAYMSGYSAWPNYYHQFGQPLNPAATFGAWPAHYAAPHWPNYAQTKKGRQTYQRYQTSVLESKFQQSSYVSKKQREELRLQTNLTDRQIKIWFQNRRMKAKKEKHRLEEGGEAVPLLPNNPPKPHDPNEEDKKWCFPLGPGAAPSPWGQMVPPPGYGHPGYPINHL